MRSTYSHAIWLACDRLLADDPNSIVIGQGVWSPWYVGSTMKDLDKKYGKERIIDTPVAESAVTGAAFGAALNGMSVVVVHPRMDFALYAMTKNQLQNGETSGGHRSHLLYAIVHRGGEQGAQHSQMLHSIFSHKPGLVVYTPSTPQSAYRLFLHGANSGKPTIYIDDRWLYETTSDIDVNTMDVEFLEKLASGDSCTIVGCGYSSQLGFNSAQLLETKYNLKSDVFAINSPTEVELTPVFESARRTKYLIVLDGSWSSCGYSSEIACQLLEYYPTIKCKFKRYTLPKMAAPCSKFLENKYYLEPEKLAQDIFNLINTAI